MKSAAKDPKACSSAWGDSKGAFRAEIKDLNGKKESGVAGSWVRDWNM